MKKMFYAAVAIVAMSSASAMFTSCDKFFNNDKDNQNVIITDTAKRDSANLEQAEAPAADEAAQNAAEQAPAAPEADKAAKDDAQAAPAPAADAAPTDKNTAK